MMEVLSAMAVLTMGFAAYHFWRGEQGQPHVFADMGDEDIKIATGSFSRGKDSAEADAAAQAYLRHKSVGNIDKARDLGESFARLLQERAAEYLSNNPQGLEKVQAHHKILLLSYVVNRVISELSPNSILAQTALNVFYDIMEDDTHSLAPHVQDMAGFSLYILCERSESCVEDEIGKIFAQLCGQEGDAAFIVEGNELYRTFYLSCSRLHESAQYQTI